jgi:hypothetical protein
MAFYQTKNPDLAKFWRVLQWKMLAYFTAIWSVFRPFWSILWLFGIFYGSLVYFSPVWYVKKNLATLVPAFQKY